MDANIGDLKNNERVMVFHLIIIIVYSFLAMVLCLETVLMDWEKWVIPILVGTIIAVWYIYIKQPVSPRGRIYMYLLVMLFALFYYGIHETSLFDIPLILLITLMLFTMVDEDFIIYFFYADYLVILFWHIFVTHAIGSAFTPLEWSRLFMNFAVVVIAGLLFRYTIHSRRRDRKNYEEVIGLMEESNKRSEDFLTNVSHELRTPINAVTGITAVMQEKEFDEEKKKSLSAVRRAGRRLSDQIGDILDYTEIDTGRLMVSKNHYMVSSLIFDLSSELDFMWSDSGNELVIGIDADLPSGLIGDASKISKVIRHLADNAMKFTKEGGVYIRIYALKRDYGINLCIQVKDTGIGISREQLERLSEHFYQADTGRSRRVGGIGLGLAVVQGLVRSMDGFMHIESEVGVGTTVHVSIPQGISDAESCMSVDKPDEVCVGCFLYPDRYSVPAVRDYYNDMIRNLGEGLGIKVHYCISMDELKKVMSRYRLTHLFAGRREYEECREYLKQCENPLHVAISMGRDDAPIEDRSVKILRKPFTVFSILQILNERDYSQKEEEKPYLPGIRTLVVDDDSMNLVVARGILGMYGMQVETAGGGAEAIQKCLKKDYDLIFMDHMMPEMDGIEAMQRIRKSVRSDRHCIIVALTANAVSGARDMFLSEGFDEFLAKPIEPLLLERCLKKLLPSSAFKIRGEAAEEIEAAPAAKTLNVSPAVAFEFTPGGNDTKESAGSEKEDRSISDKLEELGFDTKQALVFCGNDAAFYEDMLKVFVKESAEKKKNLCAFYEAMDIENYRISVHSLKSGSRTIGANQLSDKARALEEAAKKADEDRIRAGQEDLIKSYDEVVAGIRSCIPGTENENEAAEQEAKDAEWEQLISDLRSAIDNFDSDEAMKVMDKSKALTHNGAACVKILEKVFTALHDYDFMAAAEALDQIAGA
ncbi:MAG: response regulator [Lachnospiraceae bacterium]|nr:response regulator [Lachnospiraceae bacterium]